MIFQRIVAKSHRFIKRLIGSLFIMHLLSSNVFAASQNQLEGIRIWPSPDKTRVVLDLLSKPDYEKHYLIKPDRLVIDLSKTINKTDLSKIKSKGDVINRVRESASGKAGTFRLVIDLKQESKAKIFSLPPAKPYGHRLVIDLPNNKLKTKVPEPIAALPEGRNIIVAIDAGHGGDDPGALGKYTHEKKVTLQIAKRLKTKIDAQKGMQAFLIRTCDYFVNLNKRSEIARKGKADFLVSIHADGFTSSRPKGASVWVLSNRRATTELGRWMEKNEAHSELLGGAGAIIQDSDSVPFLNKMLLDMSMGNTMDVGYSIGNFVSRELSKVTHMHKKKPVHASLAVLKSPDIPSILVEAGFITNPTEERLLNQAEFQAKISNAVYKGIYKHFAQTPPQGTLFAQKKRVIKHTVRNGESLLGLAKRYSVSSSELKRYNNLKSTNLKIGQTLNIPPNYHIVVKPEPQPSLPSKTVFQKEIVHVVASGESLSVIASKYDKSVAQLKSYNKLRSTSLAVGQKLKVPSVYISSPSTPSVTKRVAQTHVVQRGESLSVIAQQYAIDTSTLKDFNKLKSTSLTVGQRLQIPGEITVTEEPITKRIKEDVVHIVKPGQSLSVIAQDYETTTTTLKTFNNLKSTKLFVGQRLNIPGVYKTVTVSPASQPKVEQKVVPKKVTHVVKGGESLSVIAQDYDTTTAALKSFNKLKSTKLFVGQRLNIPGVYKTVTVSSASQPKTEQKVVPKEVTHVVKRGESLSVIAQEYDINTSTLKGFNNLRSNSLKVGQRLKVPGQYQTIEVPVSIAPIAATTHTPKTKTVDVVVKEKVHTVEPGDALSVIAQRYSISTATLKQYNNLKSTSLKVGQRIKIPAYTEQQRIQVHEVARGESLSVIASRYGKTTNELKNYNNLRSTSLVVGQELKIPDSTGEVVVKKTPNNTESKVKAPTEHKVKSGESLSVIAQHYDRTTNQFKEINKLSSTRLYVGQVLKIPSENYTVPVTPPVHKVRSGESLSVIAEKYDTTSTQLKAYNNLQSTTLKVGQKLKIPLQKVQETKHKVRSGESLSVIAKRYGTTTNAIISTNNLRSHSLAIGQVLTIPLS